MPKMKTYIVSGFLGAGKTTLIRKLLDECFRDVRVALIENDFGEAGIDAALLRTGGFEVREISSGCICCSLSGDFVRAVGTISSAFAPEALIIEPSGVARLSDIAKVFADERIGRIAKVRKKIAVVDVRRCATYLDNFGDFFEDQIACAHVVVFSRTEGAPEKTERACEIVRRLNPRAEILSESWDCLSGDGLLSSRRARPEAREPDDEALPKGPRLSPPRAGDAFSTLTIRTEKVFDAEELRRRIARMERCACGEILRAKGIVRGTEGYLEVQYLPGELRISPCEAPGDALDVVGRGLDEAELLRLFEEER